MEAEEAETDWGDGLDFLITILKFVAEQKLETWKKIDSEALFTNILCLA